MTTRTVQAGVKQTVKNLSHSKHVTSFERKDLAWSVLLTCEHASNALPIELQPNWAWGEKDLENQLPQKHWGIDIGAYDFTMDIMQALNISNPLVSDGNVPEYPGCATAICAEFSRLLLDCNRPFGSDTMFRKECDGIEVQLNQNLDEGEKLTRKKMFFDAYHAAVSKVVKEEKPKVVFSIHSFNPVYEGSKRTMEVGVLFDESSEELGSMITSSMQADGIAAEENKPWSGKDGFMYSAQLHAKENDETLPLMIEIRNDLLLDAVAKTNILESLVKAMKSPKIFPYLSVPIKR